MPENKETSPDSQECPVDPFDQKNFEGLDLDARFSKQRATILQHYLDAYMRATDVSRDPKQVESGIRDLIEDKGLFVATASDVERYNKEQLADDTLKETLSRWKESAMSETVSTLQNLGKLDKPKKKR